MVVVVCVGAGVGGGVFNVFRFGMSFPSRLEHAFFVNVFTKRTFAFT